MAEFREKYPDFTLKNEAASFAEEKDEIKRQTELELKHRENEI